ncbi:DUF2278 family protein [Arthrobacter sp. I2-34]|uniref:DUF2278 family protein n=1 Tax=Arthrobacter hankyongi TaxID=2904801 RepID=A0ABS9L3A3_9MICC|nr:DUF2278 family protein [Arthrobacter hankyongi]MCG2621177.1 DUF2278 family protein [Arthrobacter hankyongi]
MPLNNYGVLAASAVDSRREGAVDSPHYQIELRDAAGTHYRAAVNVLSAQAPSELLYLADEDFHHPLLALLPETAAGWTPLPQGPGRANLDFIRGNLFDRAGMRPIPPNVAGPDNDLADKLDHYVQRAIADQSALVYVFGQRFGPEPGVKDKVFGFLPGNGVHDVHMNQGNSGPYVRDDGVWQDGGLLFRFPGEDRWVAVFLAFQSQSWHTDDATGHTVAEVGPVTDTGAMRILAALANPAGGAPEAESVLLINASPGPVDLAGWRLADRLKQSCPVPAAGPLPAGEILRVPVAAPAQLGNSGGQITLLDDAGLKVHGVAYTQEQAQREGWTIIF